MTGLFCDSKTIQTLDLSSFDTSKVTNMAFMFQDSKSEKITFGNKFSTPKVQTMQAMFARVKIKTLDLSGFTFENALNKKDMFHGADTTTVYLKTKDYVDQLNAVSNLSKPSTLTFIVK